MNIAFPSENITPERPDDIPQSEYAQRRARLLAQIEPNSVVILAGNSEKVRNKNILYPFRQDHDFYYLTGFCEPDAVAILRPNSEQPYILFNQPNDEFQEVWFAARTGQEKAVSEYAADAAYDIAELETRLPKLLGNRQHIYLSDELGRFQHRIFDWLNNQRKNVKFDQPKIFKSLHSILPFIHNARRIKSDAEIQQIRHATQVSSHAHRHLMQICKPGLSEQLLSAEFYNEVSKFGCNDVGYPSIVAAGNNACCLHYSENKDYVKDGELLLVDAGGDFNYYTADITRTYPVNGKFTGQQRDLYQLVLASLDAAIATVRPDANWNTIYPTAMKVLAQGLLDLNILSGSLDQVLEEKTYEAFTLHKTGHWLGLDVHDVGAYQSNVESPESWVKLQPNMVFTIEPGLYFSRNNEAIPQRWQGMGVRIEDDILVTNNGHENLSDLAPRSADEIETVMATNFEHLGQ